VKEIVVLSGKGGVGRSALTVSLGAVLAERNTVVLADTNVAAPNLHLIAGAVAEEVVEDWADKAAVDYDLCDHCLKCLDVCRFSAIIGGEEPIILNCFCEGCGACSLVCPVDAITVRPVVNGRLNILDAGWCRVAAGELDIGESGSGRLVEAVRKRARLEAARRGAGFIVIDGPPGTGSPAIAAMKGADYIILVTEPTSAALHDLQRIVDVVARYAIPAGIVLNRTGMPEAGVRPMPAYIREKNHDLLAEIPFDPLVPAALAEGRPVADAFPDAPFSRVLRRLARTMEDRLL